MKCLKYFLVSPLFLGLLVEEGVSQDLLSLATRDVAAVAAEVTEQVESPRGALNRPSGFVTSDRSLGDALVALGQQTGITLAFSHDLIPNRRVSCDCRALSLGETLDRLLEGAALSYRVMGSHVVIEPVGGRIGDIVSRLTNNHLATTSSLNPVVRPVIPVRYASDPLPLHPELRQGTIAGTVTDVATTRPLAGAQVMLDELDRAVLAMGDGSYVIPDVPSGTYQIEVAIIGYSTVRQEVTVISGETVTLNFGLRSAAISLDAVVVTGVGVQEERRRLGFASSSVGASELEQRPIQNVTQALRGQIAGLMPPAPQGEVGTASPMRIRGTGSLSQATAPLIYIDGVRQDRNVERVGQSAGHTSRLDDINPNDIERIEVIKGAAAATLFGTEASSGVIQIFTKRGAEGAPQYSFSMDQGGSTLPRDRLPPNRFYDQANRRIIEQDPIGSVTRTGHIQRYSLSVQGGSPNVRYFASGRMSREEGTVLANRADNRSLRTNFDLTPWDNLNVSLGLNVVRNVTRVPTGATQMGIAGSHILTDPLGETEARRFGELFQTIEEAINGRSQQEIDRYTIDGRVSYQWRPGLMSTVLFGYNKVNVYDIRSQEPQPYALRDPTGVRDVTNGHRSLLTMDFNTSWTHRLSDLLGMQVWGGGQAFFQESASVRVATRDFPTVGLGTLGGGSRTSNLGESYSEVINAGLFGQLQFDLANRFFITGGLRADGNSAFGDDLGLSLYPKVSGSYVLSEESFWPTGTAWQLFRLRAAYGQSGLQPGAFDAVRTWNPVNRLGGQPGILPGSVGNPLLKPERSSEFEMGFDLGRDRVGLEFTYYRQHTTDGIVNIPVSPTLGFLGSQTTNLAELETTGVEALLNIRLVESPRFGWSMTGTLGTVNETVLDIGRGDQTSYSLGGGRTQVWVAEGHPPGVITSSALDENNPYNLAVPIEELTRLDQVLPNRLQNAAGQDSIVFFKGSTPDLTASVSTDIALPRGFTVRAMFVGASGFSISGDNMLNWYQSYTAPGQAERVAELDDPSTSTERRREIAEWQARHDPNIFSNWVVDGDFIRFQELSVHYGVPSQVAARVGVSNMSLSFAAENLKLWTNSFYIGDPGQPNTAGSQNAAVQQNYQRHQLPSPRRFTLSVRGSW